MEVFMSALRCEVLHPREKTRPTEEELILLYVTLFEDEHCPRDRACVSCMLNEILLRLGWTIPLSEFEEMVNRWSTLTPES